MYISHMLKIFSSLCRVSETYTGKTGVWFDRSRILTTGSCHPQSLLLFLYLYLLRAHSKLLNKWLSFIFTVCAQILLFRAVQGFEIMQWSGH